MSSTTASGQVRGYAVGKFHNVQAGPDLTTYLERIDATLELFQGRFVVHGGTMRVLEGQPAGRLAIVEFPDCETAAAWYASDAYQEILPLRLRNADGWAVLVEGAPNGHVATDLLTP